MQLRSGRVLELGAAAAARRDRRKHRRASDARCMAGYLYLCIVPLAGAAGLGYLAKPGRTMDLDRRLREHSRLGEGAFYALTFPEQDRAPLDDNHFAEKLLLSEFKRLFGKPELGHEYFRASIESAVEAFSNFCASLYSRHPDMALPMQTDD